MTANWFVGHTLNHVHDGEAVLRACHAGAGPPVRLRHGIRRVIEAPDDRRSRAVLEAGNAGDCLALMRGLGHDRLAVAEHGSRSARSSLPQGPAITP